MSERRRSVGAFSGNFTPIGCSWWMESLDDALWDRSALSHFGVLCDLIGGRSADDTEALDYCYRRVVGDGARSSSGRLCVCLSETPPSAGEARGSIGGDGVAALIAVKASLEQALDSLPLPWTSVQRLYEVQGRETVYRARMAGVRNGLLKRTVDLEHEPIDAETRRPRSRQLLMAWLAYELGWREERASCRWPRSEPVPLIEKVVPVALAA